MKLTILRLRRMCRFLAGFVFFISGVIKLLDPVGAGLVMDEYFRFLHIGFLAPVSKVAGTAFALAESVLGAAMVTGVWKRTVAYAAFVFQGFLTILTLTLVIANPEMDCGCFGEAVHLTHMQTFMKNVVLCLMIAAAYIPMKDLAEPKKSKYVSFGIVVMSVTAFTIYSWMYIPLVDFTDFKPGMTLPASKGAADEEDRYEAVFIYEKEGLREQFTLEHLPDSSWTFVRTETVLKAGVKESGASLSIFDKEGEYHDGLAVEGRVMTFSVYDPEISVSEWEKLGSAIKNAEKSGFIPLLLVACDGNSTNDILEGVNDEMRILIESHMYLSDHKNLITMNRSNGGATYFENGDLIRKWAFRAIPDTDDFRKLEEENAIESETERSARGKLTFQGFLLYVTAVMLLL